ncbi:MAG: cytidylate kinase [Deltaproteobacteria bacterium GWA2_57_13]|nr:MAG: cytidylate kinase [Deltaproteobacteria bacterium GWA2_57_13]OGQ75182.1 MAG: cytidylate kinase [Deltaproteobacteria bacterium RIFCSPLOWO2_12_FULL_57_22]
MIIAIDGPAAAGKSTLAKRLARELNYVYVDTGAMYRALAWRVMEEGIDPGDEKELGRILQQMRIRLVEHAGQLRVLLNEVDVTEQIRAPEVSQMASKVSTLRVVRDRMVELQRAMGSQGGVVAEGRDIGTVVFPVADVKIYLDASPEERARRRFAELRSQGKQVTLEETLEEMKERDRRDQERAVAPLRKAENALVVDSSRLGAEAVVEQVMREIKNKLRAI